MRKTKKKLALVISAILIAVVGQVAIAQSSSTAYWGTAAGGSAQAEQNAASSRMHESNGLSAAAVNAADLGLLVNTGGSIVLNTIGAQNVISTTVLGDDNNVDVSGDQNSSNSGDVRTDGTVLAAPSGAEPAP